MPRNLSFTLTMALLSCACGTLCAAGPGAAKKTVESYPALRGMKVLCVKREMPKAGKKKPGITMLRGLGFPTNHECQSSVRKTGYNNEIGILDLGSGSYTTLYRPEGRSFVGHLNLHWNAEKLLFTQGDETNYRVFEMRIDGTGLRQVSRTPDDVDCFDPCYLPDGRLIVNSNAPYQSVPCWHGVEQKFVANLYVMEADGTRMRRLTFDQDHDFHPSVRHDGQVVYSRWDYTGINRIFLRPVMAMNPDGTGQKAIYGSNSWFPNGLYYPRELPGRNGRFLCVLAGYHGSHRSGALAVIDINKGTKENEGFVCQISGTGRRVEPEYKDTLTAGVWPQFITPTPVTDRVFLTSAWNKRAERKIGIYAADTDDNVKRLHAEDGVAFLEPIPVMKRPQPPAVPARVNLGSQEATAYIQDIHYGPGLEDVPRGTIKNVRVIAYDFGHIGLAGNDVIGPSGPWDAMRILGTAPVEEDGSATFKVPANTPIAFQALDAEGKAVQLMRSWVTAMPGENMSCIGCHESPNDAPLPLQTIASRRPPHDLAPWFGPARGFDFAREVQPVLNRYCVSCHNENDKLDLRSEEHFPDYAGRLPGRLNYLRMHEVHKTRFDNRILYTPAYDALVPYIRRVNVGDDVSVLEPGEYHADTSPLIQILQAGHEGVGMDEESWSRLITWIDLNGPCHGTWNDVYDMPIPAAPNVRRWELSKLYGAPAVNPDVIPETTTYDETPVTFVAPPKKKVRNKRRPKPSSLEHKTIDLGGGQAIRLVRFGEPYWMATCEISNAQFRMCDPDHTSRYYGKRHESRGDDRGLPLDQPDQPALRVSWNRAMAFCKWLSEKTGLEVTLPTEAQWETACRAGNRGAFHYRGADFSRWENMADRTFATVGHTGKSLHGHFVVDGDVCLLVPEGVHAADRRFDDGAVVTMPVGSYKPNAFGLHDMHGNVAEWTLTDFGNGEKTVKGGSFLDPPKRCGADARLGYPAWQNVHNTGFRIVIKDARESNAAPMSGKARRSHVSAIHRLHTGDESGKVEWVHEQQVEESPVTPGKAVVLECTSSDVGKTNPSAALRLRKSNIIFIYADDMGYGDCGVYNPGISIPTPNIDRLANEGLRFTDAHAPHATCTGSRYGLLTGISPARTGVRNPITAAGPAIDADEVTIAQFLRDQGYATKMVGKWHLGFDLHANGTKPGKPVDPATPLKGGPLDRGFDHFLGNIAGLSEHPVRGRHQASSPADINTQNREFCREVVRIIREQAASGASKPLFLYYALHEPHRPQIPEAEFVGRSGAGAYGDYIVQLDHWVGEVATALRETGLEKNTLLVFASDNGASKRNMSTCPGHTANGVLAGYKATPQEGGHRVPLIMKWPGFIPTATMSTALVNHTDFFATFAELLGVELSARYPGSAPDSHSFLPVLKNPSAPHKRPEMVVLSSYRKAEWKIIASDAGGAPDSTRVTALYNLRNDLSEENNLLKTNPETATRLFAGYKQFLASRDLKSHAGRETTAKKGGGRAANKNRESR